MKIGDKNDYLEKKTNKISTLFELSYDIIFQFNSDLERSREVKQIKV